MKKIITLALAALFILPVTLMAAEEETAKGSDSAAAVYQQADNIADPSATAQPAAAADIADQTPSPLSAVSQNSVAAPAKPSESMEIFNILSRTVDGLSQQVINVRSDVSEMQQQNSQLRQQITKMQYTIYGLAGVVVLLALLSLVRSRKNSAKPVPAPIIPVAVTGSTQGEYDFMGSSEAIPAKLDLARAYIAMEDFASARETLIEILTEGGEEHRLEAKSLLSKIKQ